MTSDLNKIIRKYDLSLYKDKLVGEVNLQFEGEGKRYFLNIVQGLRTEYKEKALEYLISDRRDGVYPSNIKTSDLNDREANVSVDADIELSYLVESVNASKAVYLDLFDRTLQIVKRAVLYLQNNYYWLLDNYVQKLNKNFL